MDDPTKFASLSEYYVLVFAVAILLLSEIIIWLRTLKKNADRSQKRSDQGTIAWIFLAWVGSLWMSAFFRSQSIPASLRALLLPHWVYFPGICCIFAGILLRVSAVSTLKRAFTLSVQTTDQQHLIQTGLYRWVRNPAYTGSILSLLGIALAYRHILGALSVLALCGVCYGIRIQVEEKALARQFQEEFTQYCQRTKYRLLPGVY